MKDNIIRLVEERGYAKTEYIHVIKRIINYCQKYINNNYDSNTNDYRIVVPKEITKLIDIVEDLKLTINIKDYNDNYDSIKNHSGSGNIGITPLTKIVNNKIDYIEITINGNSFNGIIFNRTLFNSLSHEFNHLYLEYKQLIRTGSNYEYYSRSYDNFNIRQMKFSDIDAVNKFIKDLFYRIIDYSEYNALINSVYGDLAGFKSERNNFRNDINNCQAYYIYKYFNDRADYVFRILRDEEWTQIRRAYYRISEYRNSDLDGFKKYFKSYIKRRLNSLIKGIGKTASYYYDSQDDFNLLKENKTIYY